MARFARLAEGERKEKLAEQDNERFLSMWPMLRQQNGWRAGKLHTVIGPTGAGKSTFVRSLLLDFVLTNPEHFAMVALSEETSEDFMVDFNRIPFKNDEPDRVLVLSEQDQNFKSFSEYAKHIELQISEVGIDLLVVDNLTTSEFYAEKKSDQQIIIAKFWKSLAQRMDIPVILIAHTSAEVTENYKALIVPEHIRGSKNVVNLSEFVYVLQPINIGSEKSLYLRVCKDRGQDVKDKIYRACYYESKRVYGKLEVQSFNDFSEAFKIRNKL